MDTIIVTGIYPVDIRPSKINNMFLVRTFSKIDEGGPYYLLFLIFLIFFSKMAELP